MNVYERLVCIEALAKAGIDDLEVKCEIEVDTLGELQDRLTLLKGRLHDMRLSDACAIFSLENSNINEPDLTALSMFLEQKGVELCSYMNEQVGSYDRFTNRVNAADLGKVFPDLTCRILWNEEHATMEFNGVLYATAVAINALSEANIGEADLDISEADDINKRLAVIYGALRWPVLVEFSPD